VADGLIFPWQPKLTASSDWLSLPAKHPDLVGEKSLANIFQLQIQQSYTIQIEFE